MLSSQVWENREAIYQAALRIERTDQTIYEERMANRDSNKRRASSQSSDPSPYSQTKRRSTGSTSQGPTYSQTGSTRSAPTQRVFPVCNQCGKQHPGECKFRLGVCFYCNEPGHFQRDYPNKGNQGRAISEQSVRGGRTQTVNRFGNQPNRGNNSGRNSNNLNTGEQGQGSQAGGSSKALCYEERGG
ncbi:hypothetical protein LINPERHAP1_LOCUS759 [Linum perenne]